jgi:8-oxo-dGTP pyrophosphatase MutT (NUDIX family)
VNRARLISSLQQYRTSYALERRYISRFIELLSHSRAYFRDHLPGHMTGSAWIVDETRNFILLTHHAKLNRWLQPGGHADGTENIYEVALQEAHEETGINDFKIISADLFDIDIHKIPARADFPEHDHYDVRLLLEAKRDSNLFITEESHALEWVAFHELPMRTGNNQSMLRMAEKAKALLTA